MLIIADRATCHTTTFLVELVFEDLCWFDKSLNPVFTCTVHALYDIILWRRDNSLIGLGGKLLDFEIGLYDITIYTNRTVRVERLRLLSSIVELSQQLSSKFRCETQYYSSKTIDMQIPGI